MREAAARAPPGAATAAAGAALSVALALGSLTLATAPLDSVTGTAPAEAAAPWEPFSERRLSELRAQGRPVFVNFTASWCITCLVNERVALSSRDVADAFARKGVVYMKGDWTRRDPEISRALESFGRSGVPLYVLYPGKGAAARSSAPVVLPQILSPATVVGAVEGI